MTTLRGSALRKHVKATSCKMNGPAVYLLNHVGWSFVHLLLFADIKSMFKLDVTLHLVSCCLRMLINDRISFLKKTRLHLILLVMILCSCVNEYKSNSLKSSYSRLHSNTYVRCLTQNKYHFMTSVILSHCSKTGCISLHYFHKLFLVKPWETKMWLKGTMTSWHPIQ